MATSSKVYKSFENFLGLDLRSSDLLRKKGAATVVENALYRETGALSKRKGYQHQIKSEPATGDFVSNGLFTFEDVNQTTGAVTKVLVGVGEEGYTKSTEDLTLTYSGSGTGTYTLKLNSVTSNFELILMTDATADLTIDLGTGKGVGDKTITTLKTAVDADADWALSAPSAVGSEMAAFLPLAQDILVSTTALLTSTYWLKMTTPGSYVNPFTLHKAEENNTNFENASFADLNNVLYMSNGFDVLHKYDGTRLYKAGIPKATIVSATGSHDGAGVIYDYKVTYEYTDAKSNFIEGIASLVTTDIQTAALGTSTITVTVDDIAATTGYDTDSSNLKVNLWRTIDYTGSVAGLYYLVETKANTAGTSLVFTDNNTDATIQGGTQFVRPIKEHGLPPLGKYLTVVGNTLVISGKNDASRTVFFSDIDSPEAFPAGDNAFDVSASVSGLGVLNNILHVFKGTSISSVSGELTDATSYAVNEASNEGIGCAAHHTIKELNRELWFLSDEGVFSISNEGLTPRSDAIKPKFTGVNTFAFKQAVAFNWTKEDKYLLFMPTLSNDSGDRISSSDASSEIFVYDYFRQAWLEWSNFNMMGGITLFNQEIWILRKVTSTTAVPDSEVSKLLNTGTEQDYADHELAITFSYATHWETLGEPSIWKKFLRIKLHSLDTSLNTFESDTFDLTVRTQHNYKLDTVATLTIDFSGGAEGYGIGDYGQFPWGESRLFSNKNKLASKKVKSHRITFTNNTAHENVLISGYELEVVTPYNLTIKE